MKKFGALIVLVMVGYFALNAYKANDIVSLEYRDYQAVQKDQIFVKGWLPDILPATVKNTKIENNLDLNSSSGSFELIKKERETLKKFLEKKESYYQYKEWVFFIDDTSDKVYYDLNITIRK